MIPRATIGRDGERKLQSDVAQPPPHMCDFGDGPRLIVGAAAIQLAMIQSSTGLNAPCIIVLHPHVAAGLSVALSIEMCEETGATLIRMARDMKRDANDAAAAALRKAAGK